MLLRVKVTPLLCLLGVFYLRPEGTHRCQCRRFPQRNQRCACSELGVTFKDERHAGQLWKGALNTSLCSSGHLLDSFARAALWDSGLDYLHGTGHGVGCFLNVHEGPCGISYKTFADEPLEAGMIVSDGIKVLSLV